MKNSMKWGLLLLVLGVVVSLASATDNTRSPHGDLNIACQNCHTVYGWKPIRAVPEFDHNQTKFPLRGMHEGVNCVNCHTKMVFSNVGTKCAECHADIHRGKMGANCESCHTVRGWNVNVAQINMHNNRFPLTGAHAAAACEDCHKSGGLSQFTAMSTDCISCHQKDFNSTTNPAHTSANFFTTTPCQSCHNADSWANANFDHSVTGFMLAGSHAVPPRACADCHKNNNYNLTSADTACIACHQNDYNNTTNPNHPQQSSIFSTTCQTCHTTVAWTPANFDHSATPFPLNGAHTVPPRSCTDCHVNNNYNLTTTTCVSCHLKDFQATTNPDHVQGNLPQTCEICHTTSAWQPASFDHSKTAFPLTGAHTVPPRACTDCHVNNNYNLTATTCVSCHLKDFNATANPNHVQGNFPQTCEVCHTTSAWQPASFDHSKTAFPLTGAHTVPPRACTDCHINNNYSLTSTACVSCHQTDYNNALTPVNHVQANFPTSCQTCHDTVLWTDGVFNHTSTGWALIGSHTVPPRACSDCHTASVGYNITSTACVSCHQTDYNNAISPVNHVAAKFPTTCDGCHDTIAWTDATFNHATTGWALTGSHTVPPRACSDCHTATAGYNLSTTTCVSCHQTDYNTATTPVNHITANFPLTCDTCHDTILWTDGKFDHSTTGWVLTGSHTVPPRACTDCHTASAGYNITSTACVTCHQTDFNNTNNPPHAASGFPTTCDVCHDTIVWTDATFNHNNTAFPLTGSHTVPPRACVDCHVNNNYTTLPTACYGCHSTDYNNTTNPGHATQPQFFPTTCQTCHTTTAWMPATFNHTQYTQFPTSHGNANNVCATCHINANSYAIFQCTGCHGGNNPANFQHDNVPGYVYNSINCYQCHASGGGG